MTRECERSINSAGLLAVIFIYCVIHALLSYGTRATLGPDESLSLVYAQDWQWGYTSDKPPLYIWMLATIQEATGPSVWTVLLLRYGLLTTTCVFTYLAGIRLLGNNCWAAVATFSLFLCFEIGWRMHEGVTYSAALSTMIMAALWAFFRLQDNGTWLNYVLFGSFLALGLLSNYNFVFFMVTLTTAAFSLESFRSKLRNPRALATIGIVLLLITPFSIWLITQKPAKAPVMQQPAALLQAREPTTVGLPPQVKRTGATDDSLGAGPMSELAGRVKQLLGKDYLHRSFAALINMLEGSVIFLFPLLVVLQLVFPGLISSLIRAISILGNELDTDKERLVLRMAIVSIGLLSFAVVIGFDRGGSQYMHPFLLPSVLLLIALVKRQQPVRAKVSAYVRILFLGSISIAVLRGFLLLYGSPLCGGCERTEAYQPLGRILRARSCGSGPVLTTDRITAGTIRVQCPRSRVFIIEGKRIIPREQWLETGVFPATVVTRTKPEARSIFSLLCERQGKPYLPPADSEMPDSAAQLQSGDWYISLANSC